MEMRRFFTACLFIFLLPVPSPASSLVQGGAGIPLSRITITVSMERPSTHYFHVQMRLEEPGSDTIDVKMPVCGRGAQRLCDRIAART